jgi:hypothetical protein
MPPSSSAHGPLALLGALTDTAQTTEQLYDALGYPALLRVGLIPYKAFRAALAELEAEGLASSGTDEDGATTWRITAAGVAVRERS